MGELAPAFRVREVRTDGDRVRYIGRPAVGAERLRRELRPLFEEYDYTVSLERYPNSTGEPGARQAYTLVAEPRSTGFGALPWTNVVLAALTVLSTLFVGAVWYGIDVTADPLAVLGAWPFTAAVLGVLGAHELGHYVTSRYHGVRTSLPYFIPFPTIFGTMGAVIRMRGRIPDRRALFDIGVAGPLAGLVATVVVTAIGLRLDPVTVPFGLTFNSPLLLRAVAAATGEQLTYAGPNRIFNPVVFGGWLGMFITFLNLLPVGQLDGGHMTRAMVGRRTETLGAAVPAALIGLGVYLLFSRGQQATFVWLLWGLLSVGLAYAGPTTPLDETPLGRRRMAVGAATFLLGLACFAPVPVEVVGP